MPESSDLDDLKSELEWIIEAARKERYERQQQERSERASVRLRPDELKTIAARAELIGMPPSSYMRRISVGGRPDTEAIVRLMQRLVGQSKALLEALDTGAESDVVADKAAALKEAIAPAGEAFGTS